MERCPLDPETLERALTGELDPHQAGILARHLAGECSGCDATLNAAGLEEEDLMLCLEASTSNSPVEKSTERVWEKVRQNLPAPDTSRNRWWNLPRMLAFSAAAAALMLAVLFWPGRHRPEGQTVKGSAAMPQVTLGVQPSKTLYSNGDTLEFRYTLDRPAHLRLLHAGSGKPPATIHDFWGEESEDWLWVAGGRLGYRFDDEPGKHLFVLIASDEPFHAEFSHLELKGNGQGQIQIGESRCWASWREVQVGNLP